jgi:hypothetical protein
MYEREAKLRCPDLEIVPYNFEAYEKVVTDYYYYYFFWDQLCRMYLSCVPTLLAYSSFYDITL